MSEEYWTAGEQREYERAYERAREDAQRPKTAPKPPVAEPAPEARSWLPVADHFPRASEKGRWQRETFAGHLSRLLPPEDDAAALAEARRLQDDREYAYGNRPELGTCLTAVRHTGPRGVTVSGSTEEVAQVFRNAGIAVQVVQGFDPPSLAPGTQPKTTRV